MTATNHTEHYGLSQYTEDDHPTYTGDYNSDMSKIDAAIHSAAQSGGLTAISHTDDLTGDGTKNTPLGIRSGTAINPTSRGWEAIDFNDFYNSGMYTFNGVPTNGPADHWITGGVIVLRSRQLISQLCFFTPPTTSTTGKNVAYRQAGVSADSGPTEAEKWGQWRYII